MSSLIANFFKRNVTLNMGATEESRPQTIYIAQYPSMWRNGPSMPDLGRWYEQAAEQERRKAEYEKFVNDYSGELKGEPRYTQMARGVWNLPKGYIDPYNDGKWRGDWRQYEYPSKDINLNFTADTSKLDKELKEALDRALEEVRSEMYAKALGISKDDLLGDNTGEK